MDPTDRPGLARANQYITALGLAPPADERLRTELRAALPENATPAEAMARLHGLIAEYDDKADAAQSPGRDGTGMAAAASLSGRVALRQRGLRAAPDAARLTTMPRLSRHSMRPPQPEASLRGPLGRAEDGSTTRPAGRTTPRHLKTVKYIRQIVLAVLVFVPAFGATAYMASVLPGQSQTLLEAIILMLAFSLFAWILIGFWSAMAGFRVMLLGDRFGLDAARRAALPSTLPDDARTAILMPICEEDVQRTFAGLQATLESLRETGEAGRFECFILSDSAEPDTVAAEELAWTRLCEALDGFGRIHYRRRRSRIKRKSGNVSDFCRRWGSQYRYMVVLDADSLMTGGTLVELVRLMEAQPDAGLIQTVPMAVNRDSVLARVQQFATSVYGRVFAAGLHYWNLNNATYWGHNAIIRVAPFRRHCALPRLSGRGALGGEIMSHDFVEAALLGRAGWGVYVASHLRGSYEELPPTLLDELKRDRRWCQGNLQHARLLFAYRVTAAHRALFANGVMAYSSALIWLSMLLLSSFVAVSAAIRGPDYFPEAGAPFPQWPVWEPVWAISLFAGTMAVLFLPKVLGMLRVILLGESRDFGGAARTAVSVLLEIVLTTLLAPIRMLAHAQFVSLTLLGIAVPWAGGQQRDDVVMPWGRALRFHAPGMAIALLWGGVTFWYTPGFGVWLLPVLLPLLVAPAVTVYSASPELGRWLRAKGLCVIPEERRPPALLQRLAALMAAPGPRASAVLAVIGPYENAIHCGMARSASRLNQAIQAHRDEIRKRAFDQGLDALSANERQQLLSDRSQLCHLHEQIWSSPRWPEAWPRPAVG